MKHVLTAAIALAALGVATGTASAQYPAVVPHRGHYHVVPTYTPQYVTEYGYPAYSPGVSFGGGYASPGVSIGFSYGSDYGGGYPVSGYGYGNSYGYGGHHHHHHHGYHR